MRKYKYCRRCGIKFSYLIEDFRSKSFCEDNCQRLFKNERETKRRATFKPKIGHLELNNLTVRSYKEVGEIMGLHPEVVRQIEHRALMKLRKALVEVSLKEKHGISMKHDL